MRYIEIFSIIYSVLKGSITNYFSSSKIYYIIDRSDWVIKDIGRELCEYLPIHKIKLSTVHYGIRNSIVHYGSITTFLHPNKIKTPHNSNKVIVSWFHVLDNDQRVKLLYRAIPLVDIWHTSSYLNKQKMIDIGIPEEKIIVIPLGVNTKNFLPINIGNKNLYREQLGIPEGSIVIGSFQKDGNGWGKGLEPKLIKGPDVFCEVIERLSKRYNIFVLLTGPSRGYVKNRLDKSKIQYRHDMLQDVNSLVDYYNAIDLYIVASREEGGPKALLESLACGVPLVSTKVGMAPDLIVHNENGYLEDVEDVEGLYRSACKIIDSKEISDKFSRNGLKTVKNYDWKNISEKYKKTLYS